MTPLRRAAELLREQKGFPGLAERTALAAQLDQIAEAEPVAWMYESPGNPRVVMLKPLKKHFGVEHPLYAINAHASTAICLPAPSQEGVGQGEHGHLTAAINQRAAIPREPTTSMMNAAWPIYNHSETCYNVWRAMYDAAIAADKEGTK